MALCPGLPGSAGTRQVKPIWILLKQETVSGSGIRWTICKTAPRSRQITTPAPYHSVFYRPDALPDAQPTAPKHWRPTNLTVIIGGHTRHEESADHVSKATERILQEALWEGLRRRHDEQSLDDLAVVRGKRLSVGQAHAAVLDRAAGAAGRLHRHEEAACLTAGHRRHRRVSHTRLLQQAHRLPDTTQSSGLPPGESV